MSFGALSLEAKMALAKGASMAGTATCSGEGGMIPPERDLSTKWYYQCIQSRYGFNPHHLMLADACEFFIGQGCKVGLGGHLMGQKVTEQVAEMRSLPAGIDQRSPARHPDWLGPDDLSLKVQEVREATDYQVPIQLKLGAARVYDDVRMAAKCGPDIIYLDGAEGGTGAGPHVAAEETGIPLMARAGGKTDVHSLEPEDLCALTVEASAMARVPLAGTNYIPGQTEERALAEIKALLEKYLPGMNGAGNG